MDFISASDVVIWPLAAAAIVVSIAIFTGGALLYSKNAEGQPKQKPRLRSVGSVAMIAGVVWGVLTVSAVGAPFLSSGAGSFDVRAPQIQAQISEEYGVVVSEEQFGDLSYPEDRPSGSAELFGSTSVMVPRGASFATREVTLLWDGAQFILATPDNDGELKPFNPSAQAIPED